MPTKTLPQVKTPARGIQGWGQIAVEVVRGLARSAMANREITTTDSVWYAGLFVDPSEFSQQLCTLQLSLQKGAPASKEKLPVLP